MPYFASVQCLEDMVQDAVAVIPDAGRIDETTLRAPSLRITRDLWTSTVRWLIPSR